MSGGFGEGETCAVGGSGGQRPPQHRLGAASRDAERKMPGKLGRVHVGPAFTPP